MIRMKKKFQSGQMPMSKLQSFFNELSTTLQESDPCLTHRPNGGTPSIRLVRGQYLTIPMQKDRREVNYAFS
ncbi:hypothetical protein IN666_01475 [Bacteroides fragilis]|nr:hypothetical protein [Bacteroides fragilis]MBW9279293.1 hypothetical protein [Bacteroides fragilis]